MRPLFLIVMVHSFKKIFSRPLYICINLAAGVCMFVLAVMLRNVPFVIDLLTSPIFTLQEKLVLFWDILAGAASVNISSFSLFLIIVMSLLFGINMAVIAHFLRQKRKFLTYKGAVAAGGVMSGMIGVGCASCSLLIGSLLALVGAQGALLFLPLRGEEFSILSIVLMAASIFLLVRSLQDMSSSSCIIRQLKNP